MALAIVIIGSFAVLGGVDRKMISEAPPLPDVYTTDARSAEFMQSGTMQTLRWMRVPGDILFSIGAALFAWFVLGLLTGHSYDKSAPESGKTSGSVDVKNRNIELAGR